jgi:hypothetical protein
MELWTVYDRPPEHPEKVAVRKVLVAEDGLCPADWQLFRSIHEARAALARRGLIAVPRSEQDDPAVVEIWL